MANNSAMAGSSGNVPDMAIKEATGGCRVPKAAACVLVALIAVAAAAVLASFVPRGHRGRRRLRRPRPWHRGRPVPEAPISHLDKRF
jgi:hypothetical protein